MSPSRSVVQVTVDASEAELVADALWQAQPSAVSTTDLPDGRVLLVADVLDPAHPAILHDDWSVQVVTLDSDAYLDVWRTWARPVEVPGGVVLHPAWLPDEPVPAGTTVVRLDPGRTFGSGSHPSTQLAIELLLADAPGARVLDVGCGSGVLAVTALLRGASGAEAIDIDPAAIVATTVNAQLNGVADRLAVSTTPVADVYGRFDLVVANIGAAVLEALAPAIVRRAAPSGALVLSGILDEQLDGVVDAYPGWTERARVGRDGWSAVRLDRRR